MRREFKDEDMKEMLGLARKTGRVKGKIEEALLQVQKLGWMVDSKPLRDRIKRS